MSSKTLKNYFKCVIFFTQLTNRTWNHLNKCYIHTPIFAFNGYTLKLVRSQTTHWIKKKNCQTCSFVLHCHCNV